jgi:hypothetical protein
MDTTVSRQPILRQKPVRPPEELVAEGMWRIAAGESCPECWDELPRDQKEWWRRCAMHAIRGWRGSLMPPR